MVTSPVLEELAKVLSISQTLTSTSLPANANVVASFPVEEAHNRGEGTVLDNMGEEVSYG